MTYRAQRKFPIVLGRRSTNVRLWLPAVVCQDIHVIEFGFEAEDFRIVDGHELQQVRRRAAEVGHA